MNPFLPHGAWKHLIYYQSAANKGCINNCLSISVVQCRFHLHSSIIIILFRQPFLNHCASFLLVLPNTSRIYYDSPSFWMVYRISLNNSRGQLLLLFSHNYSREGNYFREAFLVLRSWFLDYLSLSISSSSELEWSLMSFATPDSSEGI